MVVCHFSSSLFFPFITQNYLLLFQTNKTTPKTNPSIPKYKTCGELSLDSQSIFCLVVEVVLLCFLQYKEFPNALFLSALS
jgi:hypothetical protein